VEAVAALEAREARSLAPLHPPEARRSGRVAPRQHVLEHRAVEGSRLRERGAHILQLRFLRVATDGDLAALPGGDALFPGSVVELPAPHQDALQFPHRLGSGLQLIRERLAQTLQVVHGAPFCLTDAHPATGEDCWLKPRRLTAWAQSPAACGGLKPDSVSSNRKQTSQAGDSAYPHDSAYQSLIEAVQSDFLPCDRLSAILHHTPVL
jgi:hypothetical protein